MDPEKYGLEVVSDDTNVTDADVADLYRKAKERTGVVIPRLEKYLDPSEQDDPEPRGGRMLLRYRRGGNRA